MATKGGSFNKNPMTELGEPKMNGTDSEHATACQPNQMGKGAKTATEADWSFYTVEQELGIEQLAPRTGGGK